MPKKSNYSEEELKEAIKSSQSIAGVLRKLNLKPAGGNYKTINLLIKTSALDISHFTGAGHLKGKTHNWSPTIPLNRILVKDSTYTNTNCLKKRLLKEEKLTYECAICKISKWQGTVLVLHLDHINGTNDDNRLENLRLLCPNCHSQTETYTGKNKKKRHKINKIKPSTKRAKVPKEPKTCSKCKKNISERAISCKSCSGKQREPTKIEWPTKEELLKRLSESNYSKLGRELGVSDNAIRKFLKRS